MTQIQVETVQPLPLEFLNYIHDKISKNVEGGRPNLLSILHKNGKDEKEELLTICEQAWIKNRSLGLIAKDYDTNRKTIYRILKDLESVHVKEEIAEFIRTVPRKKRWYIPKLDVSDYETIQNYIRRARRDGLKQYKTQIQISRKAWIFFNYRDPTYWASDEVCEFLNTLSQGSQSRMLDALRQIAPQLRDEIKTGRFREKLGRHKKNLFKNEIKLIRKALKTFPEIRTLFDLHLTLGCREGSTDPRSGLAGLTWEKFKNDFTKADVYESKVRGGITWRDCPLDLFFRDLPDRLKKMWIQRGKPTNEKVFRNGYVEVREIYQEIRGILRTHYEGLIDPSLLNEFITLKPHDADKIHVNLLWEAGVPLEVVGGQFVGKGEGIGLMGRGWLDINIIKKHYLSLTGRSERFRKLEKQVHRYSKCFCSGVSQCQRKRSKSSKSNLLRKTS